jgi:hypothetical protein
VSAIGRNRTAPVGVGRNVGVLPPFFGPLIR